jgi:hypothetical protein
MFLTRLLILRIKKIIGGNNKLQKIKPLKRDDFFQKTIERKTLYVAPAHSYTHKGSYNDHCDLIDLSEIFPLIMEDVQYSAE